MATVVLNIGFDGTSYCGMQRQKNSVSIQQLLETAFEKITAQQVSVVAAGRTDAGVHANGMVVHARVDENWKIPEDAINKAVNSVLPKDVVVVGSQFRPDDVFHARFDAIAREYSYTVISTNNPLMSRYAWFPKIPYTCELLEQSSSFIVGKHNFTSFSKHNHDTKNHVCDVTECYWETLSDGAMKLHIKANRFIYGMVRSVVGVMMDVARGKRTLDEVQYALEQKDRTFNSPIAPACGLVFEKAYYPEELGVNFRK